MISYKVDSGELRLALAEENLDKDYIIIGDIKEIREIFLNFAMDERFLDIVAKSTMPKLESYRSLDYIYLYDITKSLDKGSEFWIFLREDSLILICDNIGEFNDKFMKLLEAKHLGFLSMDKVLAVFLNHLVMDDIGLVRGIEKEIEDLEESILVSKRADINREIVILKKRLLFLKHYYEQLLEVAWDIEENENNLLGEDELRSFGLFTGRLERITKSIAMLRDYLTQVREAYQSSEDIRLNETMELFTVITAIFLPLTLLTSWYGMNFKYMPELGFRYGYLGVFLVAIIILVVMLGYFKKRNMFR